MRAALSFRKHFCRNYHSAIPLTLAAAKMQNYPLKLFSYITLISCMFGLPPGAAAQAKPAEQTFSLRIEQRRIAAKPPTLRVPQGTPVRLEWSSDEAVQIHLHGYDLMLTVNPSAPRQKHATQRMQLNADILGRFPLSAHAFGVPGKAHGKHQREVTLLYLEVLPP